MPILTPDEFEKIKIHKPKSKRVNFKAEWLLGDIEIKDNEFIITELDKKFIIPIQTKFNYVKQSYYDFISLDLLPFEAKMMIYRAGGKTGKKDYITYLNRGLIILCKDLENIKGLHVHHIDGNSLNNSPDNLEALTPEEHRKKHAHQLLISDITLTLPDKPKKTYKPHTKRHISESKIYNIKKYLLLNKTANYIKKHLKTDKKTIADIREQNLDQLNLPIHLKQKLKRLKAKILNLSRQIFNFSPNKPKHALSTNKHCISNSITYPDYTFNNDSS